MSTFDNDSPSQSLESASRLNVPTSVRGQPRPHECGRVSRQLRHGYTEQNYEECLEELREVSLGSAVALLNSLEHCIDPEHAKVWRRDGRPKVPELLKTLIHSPTLLLLSSLRHLQPGCASEAPSS